MDSSFFFTILAAVIGFYVLFRKFRSHQEERETDSPSSSLLPSSLSTPSDPPASSSHNWIHDVFPSFRGEDVRKDFLSHIQKEFQRKGITPFIDNEIKRGESIGPELIRAIRGSKIAIILLSRNYASSKWCLNELVEIIKCREELGQTVMTIFYKVDPSDVKKLTGYFGKVFRNTCKGRTKEETSRWRQALETVATIAGYDSSNWDNEAAMIERMATDISNELICTAPSRDFDGLVGMKAHMDKIEPFLLLGSHEVRMIGIWGPSGIGKSTIARVLFNIHANQFQLSVFIENIKRRYPSPYYDEYSAKMQLQKDFLCQIFNHDDIRIHHLGVAQDRLKDKKVFVVLDDIDHLAQLDAIAKDTRWFGSGSRIIITTEDKRILNAHGINHIYKVNLPLHGEDLKIFCMYAFGQNFPHDGFEELSREVTELAGRLPLGLRIVGSYFKGMSKHEWIKALPRLRTSLDGEIESILKFSYDALCGEDKDLFLYIACFFNCERIEKVEEHLTKNFVDVRQGLRVLAEKSLISIGWGYIQMHDLLRRLGKEIVRKQSIYNPGQRQFLFDIRDICQVLNNDALGGGSVTCTDYKYCEIEDELHISEGAFERMANLQFLRAHSYSSTSKHTRQPRVINLPQKVRLLHWEYFPLTSLPCNFNTEFLIELNMRYSKLEKLWERNQTIKNLKWVNLSSSENLKELPDLSTATNLEEVNLEECSSLRELPSSIGNAINLRKLNLRNCSRLVELPSSFENLISLHELDLRDCSSLVNLPSSIGKLIKVENLDLKDCSSLLELPSSIGNLINLTKLNLLRCSSLVKLPSSIGNLQKLERLHLEDCSKLESIPTDINMESLDVLNLEGCSSLKNFPEISTNISILRLRGTAIEEVPSSIRNWSHLDVLNMSYSINLGNFLYAFDYITGLHLKDTRIQEIAPWVKELSRLETLVVKGCTELVSLPQLPESLAFLDAENCESLESLDCSLHSSKFIILNFGNCFKLNQEARDLIIKTPTCKEALVPGEEVPTYFTYRAHGSSLLMRLNELDTHLPVSLKFKACVLPIIKGTVEVEDRDIGFISYRITQKHNSINVPSRSNCIYLRCPHLMEHLYIFEFDEEVSSSELFFEFKFDCKSLEIGECGIRIM